MSAHWAPGATQDFAFLVILGNKMPGTVRARSVGKVSSQVSTFPPLSPPPPPGPPPPHIHTEEGSVLTGATSEL